MLSRAGPDGGCGGVAFCESQYRKRRRREAVEAGVCSRCCAKPAKTNRSYCDSCAAVRDARVRRNTTARIAAGICVKCKEPLAGKSRYCIFHWMYHCACKGAWHKGRNQAGITASASELLELYIKQGKRCSYTGVRLIPGVNMSIDHIVPASRGGPGDISNLQWVTKQVNRMKTDLSDEEFVAMCQTIAERAG